MEKQLQIQKYGCIGKPINISDWRLSEEKRIKCRSYRQKKKITCMNIMTEQHEKELESAWKSQTW